MLVFCFWSCAPFSHHLPIFHLSCVTARSSISQLSQQQSLFLAVKARTCFRFARNVCSSSIHRYCAETREPPTCCVTEPLRVLLCLRACLPDLIRFMRCTVKNNVVMWEVTVMKALCRRARTRHSLSFDLQRAGFASALQHTTTDLIANSAPRWGWKGIRANERARVSSQRPAATQAVRPGHDAPSKPSSKPFRFLERLMRFWEFGCWESKT